MDPGLDDDEAALLSRSIYSCVHGIVSLGLEDRMDSTDVLGRHVETIVGAFIDGYAARAGQPNELGR